MNILHITDDSFTDERWQAYYSLMEILNSRFKAPMAKIGWEPTKKRFLSLTDIDPDYYRFVIFDKQTAVGWADFNVQAPNTPEQIYLFGLSLPVMWLPKNSNRSLPLNSCSF